MDRLDDNVNGNGPNDFPLTDADAIAFRAAMRDDPAVPLSRSHSDEGGPVSVGRVELGYPFEDADVLADLFLDDFPTVAKIGPGGVVRETVKAQDFASAVSSQGVKAAQAAQAAANQQGNTSHSPVPFARAVATGAPTIEAKPSKPMIEALLVGHLPVLGSAWVSQYAKHIAQKTGEAVGLVRLTGGEATIDLALPPSVVPPQAGPMPSVGDAMRFVSAKTQRWVVRLDDAAERTSAAEMARSIHASDRVTVLTGSDEAAVVGCYRVIKTLEAGEATPAVHVAVMGSEGDRAEEAASKLSRAAEKFLGTKVTSEACSARITPGSSVNVYRGRPNLGHADLVEMLKAGPGVPIAATSASPALNAVAHGVREASPVLNDVSSLLDAEGFFDADEPATEMPEIVPADEPASAREHVAATSVSVHATSPSTTAFTVPGRRPLQQTSNSTKPNSLARHLGSLESLPTVCPYAPDVELAIDPEGKLHLIASTASSNDPGATLTSLTTVRAWAEAHASLIAMAHPRMRGVGAVCHLLTDAPKSVRRLADSDLRLHLLTAPPGTKAEDAGWVCVELN